jgi:hypothetical protein
MVANIVNIRGHKHEEHNGRYLGITGHFVYDIFSSGLVKVKSG